MGFFDKVKKTFGSKKEDTELHNGLNDKTIGRRAHDVDVRNFRYLDDLIHGGAKEIVLDSDIIWGDGEESEYRNGIELDVDDLTIDGNGHAMDSEGKARIFRCRGKNITIKNITLRNGHAGDGGAIYNEGELSVIGCRLNDNSANRQGGAIYNYGGTLFVGKSEFRKNSSGEFGGAIHSKTSFSSRCSVRIDSSLFTGNSSDKGGAIYNAVEMALEGSAFDENSADAAGSAIYNSNIMNISDSAFTSNGGNGSAIRNEGKMTIDSSRLAKNTAGALDNTGNMSIISSTLDENEGDTIINTKDFSFKSDPVLQISKCEISNNQAPLTIIDNFSSGLLEMHYTEIHGNRSENIVANGSKEFNFSIIECKFLHNTAENSIIYNHGKSCTIKKSVFEDNLARNASALIVNESRLVLISQKIKGDGKAILNEGHILLKHSDGLEGNIGGEGSVATDEISPGKSFDFEYLDMKITEGGPSGVVLEEDITIGNYEIDYYEGGIELDTDGLVIDGNNHVIDGADMSRIFIVTADNITLKNIIFKNGHSFRDFPDQSNTSGGAIKVNRSLKLTIENCKFMDNTSEEHGGAIYDVGGELNIFGCRLEGNSSNDDAGALYINGCAANISGSSFIANASKSGHHLMGGGAIRSIDSRMIIEESEFNENSSNRQGGAIYNSKGVLDISKSAFSRNISRNENHGSGGAIRNTGTLSIMESALDENASTHKGGAIHNEGAVSISKSALSRNSTGADVNSEDGGGAIYNFGELSIMESELNANVSKNEAGAIFNYMKKLSIFKSYLNENICEHEGGAIYNFQAEFCISESTLTANTAKCSGKFDKGGAIHNYFGDPFNVEECTFRDNDPEDIV